MQTKFNIAAHSIATYYMELLYYHCYTNPYDISSSMKKDLRNGYEQAYQEALQTVPSVIDPMIDAISMLELRNQFGKTKMKITVQEFIKNYLIYYQKHLKSKEKAITKKEHNQKLQK